MLFVAFIRMRMNEYMILFLNAWNLWCILWYSTTSVARLHFPLAKFGWECTIECTMSVLQQGSLPYFTFLNSVFSIHLGLMTESQKCSSSNVGHSIRSLLLINQPKYEISPIFWTTSSSYTNFPVGSRLQCVNAWKCDELAGLTSESDLTPTTAIRICCNLNGFGIRSTSSIHFCFMWTTENLLLLLRIKTILPPQRQYLVGTYKLDKERS